MMMLDLGREMRVLGRSVTSAATSQITDLSIVPCCSSHGDFGRDCDGAKDCDNFILKVFLLWVMIIVNKRCILQFPKLCVHIF